MAVSPLLAPVLPLSNFGLFLASWSPEAARAKLNGFCPASSTLPKVPRMMARASIHPLIWHGTRGGHRWGRTGQLQMKPNSSPPGANLSLTSSAVGTLAVVCWNRARTRTEAIATAMGSSGQRTADSRPGRKKMPGLPTAAPSPQAGQHTTIGQGAI